MTRKQILEQLSGQYTTGHYQELKNCLGSYVNIDPWFKGVVSSIKRYQPNTKLLALVGPQAIGKTHFFENLLPDNLRLAYLSTVTVSDNMLYNNMIVDFAMRKSVFEIIKLHHFRIDPFSETISTDKRLCSLCTTNNEWPYPQRKNVIVVKVEKIDWEKYNNIDKLELWKEIFNTL